MAIAPALTNACFVLDTPAALSAAVAQLSNPAYGFSVPLYRAALADRTRVVILLPGGRVPGRLLDHRERPTVLVVGGDGAAAVGPDGFAQARRLLAWAGFATVHATGGQPEHYQAAAEAAPLFRRSLLIETATAHEGAWLAAATVEEERRRRAGRMLPLLLFTARPHGSHPHRRAA